MRLNQLGAECDLRVTGAMDICQTDCLAGRIETEIRTNRWQTWEVALAIVITAVVGAGVGTIVGVVAR